jgi:hypothetical protein
MTWGTPASTTFNVDHTTNLSKYNFVASWNRVDAATTQLAQSGVATLRGSIDTYTAGGGITHDLSRIDSLSWTANGTTVSYTDPNQSPYLDFTSSLAWNHDVSQTTSLVNSVNFDWFSENNDANSQRLFWRFMTGLQTRITPRLSFGGDVGLGFVNSYQSGTSQSTVTPNPAGITPFQPQVGTGNSVLADFNLTYDLLKTTKVSLTAAQTIVPLITGQLQKSDTVGVVLNHNINYFSNISVSTQLSYIPAVSGAASFAAQNGASEFFSAGVSYGYQLGREWRTSLSYTYLQRNDDTGIARSSLISFSLSRDFTLLGNPTAINQAEAERARQRERSSVGYVFPNFR